MFSYAISELYAIILLLNVVLGGNRQIQRNRLTSSPHDTRIMTEQEAYTKDQVPTLSNNPSDVPEVLKATSKKSHKRKSSGEEKKQENKLKYAVVEFNANDMPVEGKSLRLYDTLYEAR